MAVRLALGAGRWDIARTLIVENLLVAFAGGLAGLLLTSWGLDLARRSAPPFIVQHVIGLKHLGVDWRVVAFTLGVATLTGILISLAPLLQITHAGVVETLKEGGRGTSAGARGSAVRSTLVVSEVALALVLLVGAGLMVKGFRALANAYPGFDRTHVLTFRIALPSGYREPAQIRNFYQELVQKVQTLPGVECAATVSSIPSSWSWDSLEYSGDGLAPQAPGEMRIAVGESITPDYFRVMHIPVLHGRAFSDKDGPESERVAIVSESLARRNWPGENPIGKHIRLGRENSNQPPLAIVGIVGDVKQSPFSKEVRPTTYTPFAQSEEAATSIVVRTAGDPIAMAPAAWAMVRSIDPDLPAFDMRTLAQIISDSLSGVENASRMMIVFGIVALVLAAAGVFAVMAYSVTQRTHEIGVRLALGAQHTDIYRMVVGYATRLAMMGLVVGVPCALGLSFLFSSAVFGVLDIDVLTFGGLTILLVLVALGAAIIPARRATKVDPMVALRYE
jgi:putative ABC transport system permease protein